MNLLVFYGVFLFILRLYNNIINYIDYIYIQILYIATVISNDEIVTINNVNRNKEIENDDGIV